MSTSLRVAATLGRVEDVRVCLDRGDDAGEIYADGSTPLHCACAAGHSDVATLLCDRGGVDVNHARPDGATAFFLACQRGHIHAATLLCDRGADVNQAQSGGWTPLHVACLVGNVDVMRLCLDHGVDLEKAEANGGTALLVACLCGHVGGVQLLLDRGAAQRAKHDGSTPLHAACFKGHLDVARLLLEFGADTNLAAQNGMTALHSACWVGNVDAVLLCLEHGAELNRTTGSLSPEITGLTPERAALHRGHEAMAAWLARIQRTGGWASYMAEPRYKLVVLRALVAKGRARRQGTLHFREQMLDFVFPGEQAPPRANKQAKRDPRLPNSLFPRIARYYCGAGLWPEDEAGVAAEAARPGPRPGPPQSRAMISP